MANGNVNFGLSISQRNASSVSRFAQHATSIFQGLRVAVPAVVQSFNPGPPATVNVTIAINEDVQLNANRPGGPTPGPLDLQVQKMTPGYIASIGKGLIQDVPVQMPSGGGYSLTFPIKEGDECLLIFCDLELDQWLDAGGVNNTTISSRRHDLSDAIAIFGLKTKPKAFRNYPLTSAQLRNDAGTVVIDLAATKIKITAPTVEVDATNVQVNTTNATVAASGTVGVSGDTVNVTGSSEVNISGAGNTYIEGKNFLYHTHNGVQVGGGVSGPVV